MKIISGGQTGVDRAALDFALCNNMAVAGWCPQGCTAEDGLIPPVYPLNDTFMSSPIFRTQINILESDAVLILIFDKMDTGTQQTYDLAHYYGKPVFVWRIGINNNYYQFRNWLNKNGITTLNIAGPRESNQPGIYSESLNTLDELLAESVPHPVWRK
jgi:hypothetical protein